MESKDAAKNPEPLLNPERTLDSVPDCAPADNTASSDLLRARIRFVARLRWLLLLVILPGWIAIAYVLIRLPIPIGVSISILFVLFCIFLAAFFAAVDRIVRPLQVLANVVAALREDDYSFRARSVLPGDALGDLSEEINQLANGLQLCRHAEQEASALLARVIETMDIPVFAFDGDSILRLTNPAAAHLLGHRVEMLLHQSAQQLGLTNLLLQPEGDVVVLRLGERETRWMVRRSLFYQSGMPHRLLLLTDVSHVLREEERRAWRRLIRVLTHEVNNSLTPIKSIAGSLRTRIAQAISAENETAADFERGLAIVEERADSLNRFLYSYGRLARLPHPVREPMHVGNLIERVCHLETRMSVAVKPGPDVEVFIDVAQMEQALINLIRNAVDAVAEPALHAVSSHTALVRVNWMQDSDWVCIQIEDNGPGLANPANLFIPFYTTKVKGSGIGLVLARQIVELHEGTLSLRDRPQSMGCVAELRLPIRNRHSPE